MTYGPFISYLFLRRKLACFLGRIDVRCKPSSPVTRRLITFATEMPPTFDSDPNRQGSPASPRRFDWLVRVKNANAMGGTNDGFRPERFPSPHQFMKQRSVGTRPSGNVHRDLSNQLAIRVLRLNAKRRSRQARSVVVNTGWLAGSILGHILRQLPLCKFPLLL